MLVTSEEKGPFLQSSNISSTFLQSPIKTASTSPVILFLTQP